MGFAIGLSGDDMRESRLNLLLANPPGKRGGNVGQLWQQTVAQLLTPLGVKTFEANSGPAAVELMERVPIHLAVVDTRLPAIGGLNVLQLIQRLKEHGQRHALSGPKVGLSQAQVGADPSAIEANLSANLRGGGTEMGAQKGANDTRIDAESTQNPTHFDAGNTHVRYEKIQFQVRVEHRTQAGNTQQRFEVRFETRGPDTGTAPPYTPPPGPVVILIAPPPAQQDKELLREALKFNAFSVLSEPVDVEVALEVMARAMKRWFSGAWPA
jgi:CheY-like chemotaxis protein